MAAVDAWRAMLGLRERYGPVGQAMASPFSPSSLQSVVLADIFGSDRLPVTRDAAMAIPAVARARHLICGKLSRYPLRVYRGTVELAARAQPSFLHRTNGRVAPQLRMLWTLDDLIFNGWSLWAVERGAEEAILDAWRVPVEWWEFTPDNVILVNGAEVTDESCILFSGPFEGLLEAGAHTVRAFQNLERAWAKRVRQPIPASELHQNTDDPMTEDEIKKLLDDWGQMLDEGGGVAYTPSSIEYKAHGEAATNLFIEGRNAATQDIARLLNVPSTLLDASMATASLQYATRADGRSEFFDDTLGFWATPIEARLSMDDVVPRGQRIGFDLPEPTEAPRTSQISQTGTSPEVTPL